MTDRALTAGERQMVLDMFGDSIDVDTVKISDQAAVPFQVVPMVPTGETVFWPDGLAGRPRYTDFSDPSVPLSIQGDFMHEITHVWQNQHGQQTNSLVFEQATKGQALYDLSTVTSETPWENLNLEQQAEVVKNLYISWMGGKVSGTITVTVHLIDICSLPAHSAAWPVLPVSSSQAFRTT